MRQIHIYPQGTMQAIELGLQGEDRARQVVFHVDGWSTAEELTLLYRRHGDAEAYPVALELSEDGALAVWTVTATDTAQEGAGRAELWATSADSLDKSATFFTVVGKALGAGNDQGGVPGGDWVMQALRAAAEAKAAAEAVSGEMDAALGKVQEAQSRTESAHALAEDAANRVETLLSEVDAAQSAAAESASAAADSAQAAAESVSAAAGSAQAAAESATRAASAVSEALSTKQDKLTGTLGQVVGFSSDGSAAAVQGWSNPNLLDNWYFASPINQRGVSGTITASGYFIDRWRLISGTVELTAGGLILNGTMAQILETAPAGTVKASALATTGVVPASYDASGKTFTIEGTGQTFVAAKLELGPQQTLAHQDASGNWVLNDPPPNKALELANCQRYMNKINYDRRLICYMSGYLEGFSFPQMRATPTVSCNVVLPGHADSPLSATPTATPDGINYIYVPEATVGTWYILTDTLLDANL